MIVARRAAALAAALVLAGCGSNAPAAATPSPAITASPAASQPGSSEAVVSPTPAAAATPTEVATQTATPTPAPTTVWTAFTSTQFAYTVSYPAGWSLRESDGVSSDWFGDQPVAVATAKTHFVSVRRRPLQSGQTLATIVARDPANYSLPFVSKAATTLGGEPAWILTYQGPDVGGSGLQVVAYRVWAVRGKYAYEIQWDMPAADAAAYAPIVSQFDSSFAFK